MRFLGTGSLSTGYHTPNLGGGPVRLTKDMLLVTQKHRAMDVRPKPEAYAKYVLIIIILAFSMRFLMPYHFG